MFVLITAATVRCGFELDSNVIQHERDDHFTAGGEVTKSKIAHH